MPDKQYRSNKSSALENEKTLRLPLKKKTWVGKNTPKVSQEKNEPKTIGKPTKSWAGKTLKLLPKIQKKPKAPHIRWLQNSPHYSK